MVSRSFNSQQSQKEDTTQEGAKAIRKKLPGKTLEEKRTCKKAHGAKSPGTLEHSEVTRTSNSQEMIPYTAQIL